jgi:hypothetical protein
MSPEASPMVAYARDPMSRPAVSAVQIDGDEGKDLASALRIRAMPTVVALQRCSADRGLVLGGNAHADFVTTTS